MQCESRWGKTRPGLARPVRSIWSRSHQNTYRGSLILGDIQRRQDLQDVLTFERSSAQTQDLPSPISSVDPIAPQHWLAYYSSYSGSLRWSDAVGFGSTSQSLRHS